MKNNLLALVFLIVITIPTLLPFFNARFFYTQDYIFIARLQQMSTALADGQFPVRWAPDLRFGEPTFNYYAPFPYYIGALVHLLGINYIWTAKILFMLGSILSAFAMYFFIKELLGQKAGLVSAVLYTYAPYRAVDIYVRGSLSETWAFIFFPLIFYYCLKIVKQTSLKNATLLALSLAGLFLTHNVTTLMFAPFLIFWMGYLIWHYRNFKSLLYFIKALVLAVGLSAFFLLPAFLERNFIQTKYLTVGYFNFRAHFVAVQQFFSLFWGYGSSVWGPEDGLSFQVGLINWLIVAAGIVVGFISRKDKKTLGLLIFLAVSLAFSVFLQHNKSAFVWEAFSLMAFIQFPWRFLAISIFIAAIAGGVITPIFKSKQNIFLAVIIIASIAATFNYFKPKEYSDDSFFDKFVNVSKMHQGVDLTKDYLPIWAENTDIPFFETLNAVSGNISVTDINKRSTSLTAKIKTIEDSEVVAPITYFPGWHVLANGQSVAATPAPHTGLITFKLPKGEYNVAIALTDTPIRVIGNWASLFSLVVAAGFLLIGKRYSK